MTDRIIDDYDDDRMADNLRILRHVAYGIEALDVPQDQAKRYNHDVNTSINVVDHNEQTPAD